MSQNKKIVAERTGWVVVAPIIMWISEAIFVGLFAVDTMFGDGFDYTLFILGLAIIAVFCYAVFCTITALATPRILADFSEGLIIFYPKRGEKVVVKPCEIQSIAQKNLRSAFKIFKSGKLLIERKSGLFELKWVKNTEETCRIIYDIKNEKGFL